MRVKLVLFIDVYCLKVGEESCGMEEREQEGEGG
jgi:hypothetical protein